MSRAVVKQQPACVCWPSSQGSKLTSGVFSPIYLGSQVDPKNNRYQEISRGNRSGRSDIHHGVHKVPIWLKEMDKHQLSEALNGLEMGFIDFVENLVLDIQPWLSTAFFISLGNLHYFTGNTRMPTSHKHNLTLVLYIHCIGMLDKHPTTAASSSIEV